jgi:hypothetical protein
VIHPRTQAAIDDVRRTFGDDRVTVEEIADGSVWLTVKAINIGPRWTPTEVDLAVKLVPTFPDTQPYPWYLPADLCRIDDHVIRQLQVAAMIDGHNCRQLSLGAPWKATHSLAERIIGAERWLRNQRPASEVAP